MHVCAVNNDFCQFNFLVMHACARTGCCSACVQVKYVFLHVYACMCLYHCIEQSFTPAMGILLYILGSKE